jgi:predicted ester cyclase
MDGKQAVRRLAEIINTRELDELDRLVTDGLAPKLRRAFEQFLVAFPDWHQEVVELVAEGDTVAAHFRCTGTQTAPWQGLEPTGRAMDVDEVSFVRVRGGRITSIWSLEDTWTRARQLAGREVSLGELGSLS